MNWEAGATRANLADFCGRDFLADLECCAWCGRPAWCGLRRPVKHWIGAGGDADYTERRGDSQGVEMGLWERWEMRGEARVVWVGFPIALNYTGGF
jgi:hypothetical protein